MNIVVLVGNITEDVKVFTNKDGTKIVKGVVAITRKYSTKKASDYVNFTVIGNSVDYVVKYGKKGAKAIIQGSWNHSSFKDKQGNYKNYDACLVEDINIISNVIREDTTEQAPQKAEPEVDRIDDIDDDDLPF